MQTTIGILMLETRFPLSGDRRVGAIVLECANMPPYASAVASALQLPVYDWYSMVCWFAHGLRPRTFFPA